MNKILILFQDARLPSSRIRMLNLIPSLSGQGLVITAQQYPSSIKDKLDLYRQLSGYDAVVLQKKLLSFPDFKLLKMFSRRIVYDFDDAVYIRDDQATEPVSRTRLARFSRTVANSDLVVAGTPFLAEEAARYTKNISVVPSAVEVTGVPAKNWQTANERFVIGWVGSGGNLRYLENLAEPLRKLAGEYPLELRVISNKPAYMEGVPVVNIQWTLEGQAQEIARFDAGLMPLPKTKWSQGKCSYKALQYMAAGVPVVATDWGYNRQVIREGETGLLAEDDMQYYSKIRLLIQSPELAKRVGEAGRRLVEREYSIEVVGERLARSIKDLLQN